MNISSNNNDQELRISDFYEIVNFMISKFSQEYKYFSDVIKKDEDISN